MTAEHWRLFKNRYNLRGERRKLEDGSDQFKLNGSNSWTEPQPNGHHRHEDPRGGKVINQAPHPTSENGRKPKQMQGSVENAASTG